jgi:hypothetical protein
MHSRRNLTNDGDCRPQRQFSAVQPDIQPADEPAWGSVSAMVKKRPSAAAESVLSFIAAECLDQVGRAHGPASRWEDAWRCWLTKMCEAGGLASACHPVQRCVLRSESRLQCINRWLYFWNQHCSTVNVLRRFSSFFAVCEVLSR